LLVFGDGMHQTDGANVHCLRLTNDLPFWHYAMPGTLVHTEGSPTIANDQVYLGAGNAGVICMALEKVSLDGKDLDIAAATKLLDESWRALQMRYEQD